MNLLELLRPYYNPDNGDKVLHVYIVGPYPTEDFFYNLFDSIKFDYRRKNIITFLVDKSSYDKAIEIRKSLIKNEYCYDNQFDIKAISGNKGRFVHSKIYYFEIEKPSGMIYTCLITGSGNASTRAYSFESDDYKNAEINLVTTIKQEDREFIENYFTFRENDTNILHITAADTKVYFPIIKYKSMEKRTDYFLFSNWVLSGYVYHQYSKVNDIGKIRIKLKEPAKANTQITKLADERGFYSDDLVTSIAYKYIDIEENTNSNRDDTKRMFLCETSYGYWVPRELKWYVDKAIINNKDKNKEQLLKKIKNFSEKDIDDKVDKVLEKIKEIFKELSIEDKHKYFECNGNMLNEIVYRDIIYTQISRQYRQCKNEKFCERYINGYDNFNASYLENCIDDLVEEVIDAINIKLTKDTVFNFVCQAVKFVKEKQGNKDVSVEQEFLEINLEDIISRLNLIIEEYNQK